MKAIPFEGANLRLKPPDDWDEAKHGPCDTIYGYRDLENGTTSAVWTFTPEERARIAAGENILVHMPGRTLPAMSLSVARIPEASID